VRQAGDLEMTWSASPPRTYATPKFRELGVLSASREEEHHEAHREERERRRSGHGRDEALRPRCLYHRGGMDVIPEEKLVEGDLVRDRIDAVEIGREIGLETRIGRVGDPEAGGVGRDILREIENVARVSGSSYTGVFTDVGFNIPLSPFIGSGVAMPNTIDRSGGSGDAVGFNFMTPLTPDAAPRTPPSS